MLKKYTFKEILDLSIPIIAEMTLYNLMGVFDTMMIGNYGGNKYLSAIGLSNGITYNISNIFVSVGLSVAITSLVAQSVGRRNYKEAEAYATLGFIVGNLIGFFISFNMYKFSKRILYMAGGRGEILYISNIFTRISVIGIFLKMNTEIINSVLRGYKNTKVPFITSIIISSFKILLDFILIFGHGTKELGIVGAAVATCIAQAIGLVFSSFYIVTKLRVRPLFEPVVSSNITKIKEIFRIYVPSFMEEGAYSISRLLCSVMIIASGSINFAANEIANTIETISIVPSLALGVAATSLVGAAFGEKNYKKAKKYAYGCTAISVVIAIVFSLVFVLMPNFLVHFFVQNKEKQVIYLASMCLLVGAIEQPFIAISTVYEGALKGIGDGRTPLIVTLITGWILRVPLIYCFIYKLKYSVVYVWWITNIQWIVDGILICLMFNLGFSRKLRKYGKYKL
ncbi:MATE family efflux transporter [Clostridium niameyense]|uniref:Probable multidrug resistance protein NorM n=1 Tax=Clostridium niameyense TaxID=1622073 RepID=A0A6M0RAD0_9CLOT|nr:MATE family efflux transporter [Clostridium niameyense]NEZ47166.1 MATE family efflux transporter [Clostridium niameyense]